jgi:hypothetical protein
MLLLQFPFVIIILFITTPTTNSFAGGGGYNRDGRINGLRLRTSHNIASSTSSSRRSCIVISGQSSSSSSMSMSMASTAITDAINSKEIDIIDQEQQLLCNAAEKFINTQSGYYNAYNDDNENNINGILSDDFVFRGPIIGPLNKNDYIEVLEYFQVYKAFPDIKPNTYGFIVDPFNSLKVRFFLKATGTYQNPLGGLLGQFATTVTPPDSRQYIGSTEAWAITFNSIEKMQIKCITAGYVIDNFEQDDPDIKNKSTTNGKGLTFGILNTLNIPFPTTPGSIGIKSIQSITGKFTTSPTALFPKSSSDPETIPQWWKDQRRGAE